MVENNRRIWRTPLGELERRWAAVRQGMAARRVDVLVAQSERDFSGGYCRWFTDAPAANPKSVLFYADGGLTLIDHGAAGRRRDLRAAPDPEHPGVTEVITTSSFQNADYTQGYDADCAADVLVKRAVKRIGLIAPRRMPHGFVSRLMETLGEAAEFSDETDFIDALKAVKSPSEIEAIRATAQMQDAAFAEVLSKIRPGMRDFEITALARYHGEMMGSEQGLFLGVSATLGTPAGLAPKHVQGRAFERGDYMTLLIENNGPGGYYAELARLIVFGKASAELEEAFACTKQAQAKTAANLRPGASPAEICQAHNAFMTACGGPPEARLYAHSQGYDLVERPLVRDDETMALQANMNMAVHPSWGSSTLFALVCDNYLVRDNGPAERLHRTEQKIFEL